MWPVFLIVFAGIDRERERVDGWPFLPIGPAVDERSWSAMPVRHPRSQPRAQDRRRPAALESSTRWATTVMTTAVAAIVSPLAGRPEPVTLIAQLPASPTKPEVLAPFGRPAVHSILSLMSSALFNVIHDGRPERLAQLLLHHALQVQTEPGLRRLLKVPGGDVQVRLERGDDQENPRRGWRADIVVTWTAGDTWPAGDRRLELKLGAKLTPAQQKALSEGKMHVLVVPSSRKDETEQNAARMRKHETVRSAERVQVVSWSDVAEAIENDNVLKVLLQQADSAYSWFCETLLEENVRREIDSYASGGPDARWPQLYRFLSTVDARLQEEDRYCPTGGWSKSRRPDGYAYYGYAFRWSSDPGKIPSAWIGFERLGDGTVNLCMYENNKLVVPTMPLDVDAAAAHVVNYFTGR